MHRWKLTGRFQCIAHLICNECELKLLGKNGLDIVRLVVLLLKNSYRDFNELRFALRSVWSHLPLAYFQRILLITPDLPFNHHVRKGLIPTWLNLPLLSRQHEILSENEVPLVIRHNSHLFRVSESLKAQGVKEKEWREDSLPNFNRWVHTNLLDIFFRVSW